VVDRVGGGVAFEAATDLRPILWEKVRFGAAIWAACISSAVLAQYGVLTLTGTEGAAII
jgi:hypothetical protein